MDIFVVVSLPEAQKAPPKECKQLQVFKSKIHGLHSCVALLMLKSLEKMTHQNASQKVWILQHQKPRAEEY